MEIGLEDYGLTAFCTLAIYSLKNTHHLLFAMSCDIYAFLFHVHVSHLIIAVAFWVGTSTLIPTCLWERDM